MSATDLLTFPIDVDAVLSHMRQDLKDDWFFDPFNYLDLFKDRDSLIDVINESLHTGHGHYETGSRQVYDVPKASLGLRYSLEVDFYDRFLYQAICSFLIPYFDPLLSNRVFSHRYNKFRSKEKDLFKSRIDLWQTFEGFSRLGLEDGKTLLVTDLINYFEYISIESIESSFLKLLARVHATGAEKTRIRSAIFTLTKLLEKWCFNNRFGLPQNRDPSSFIANIVLSELDQNMINKGYDYLRYVDDIRIVCETPYSAKQALNDLIGELRKLGLNINSKKTIILDASSTAEDKLKVFPGYDDLTSAVDSMWRSRSKKLITRSIQYLTELLIREVETQNTQSRTFRFCINRFKSLIATDIFDLKSVFATQIANSLISNLEAQPVSTDQFCKLLSTLNLENDQLKSIENFLLDENKAIFEWQNYHLWILCAKLSYASDDLIQKALNIIEHKIKSAEVPACFIYLACVAKTNELVKFIPSYTKDWPYQHKRLYLIAMQATDGRTLSPLRSQIDYRVSNTIQRLRGNALLKDKYFIEEQHSEYSDIYDELNPYD
jgi:hypothetical protein